MRISTALDSPNERTNSTVPSYFEMAGIFREFIGFLNTGCDEKTDLFIEKTFKKLNTISAIYPILDDEKPLLCLRNFAIFLTHSSILMYSCYLASKTSLILFDINFVPFVHEIHIGFLALLSIAILWHSWLKRPHVARLYRFIDHDLFDYEEELEEQLKLLRSDRMRERKRYILCVIMIGVAASVAVILIPSVNKLGTFRYNATLYDVNFELAVPVTYPFTSMEPVPFFFENAYIMLTSTMIALMNCTKSLMAIESNLSIQMHLKLLLHQIENIEARAVRLYRQIYGAQPKLGGLNLYSKHFSKCYSICLKKTIQHHHVISE
ncbi:unnamed protein product [Nezara viridula]|uniref:Odorant receptor n=1 Tax=Nezara viridula TaxID=85310 RepID=A0A9P0E7Q6_NEZVI|nr:unnamed protein product [Nezara viridula]